MQASGRCKLSSFLYFKPLFVPIRACSLHTSCLPPSPPPPLASVRLNNRSLIELQGENVSNFLQGLTTANLPTEAPDNLKAFYSAFLNAQGRLLQDVFIYPLPSNSKIALSNGDSNPNYQVFLLEVDAGQSPLLTKWLKKYRLRSKLNIRELPPEHMAIYSVWNETMPFNSFLDDLRSKLDPSVFTVVPDLRAPNFAIRVLVAGSQSVPIASATLEQYAIRRYLHGVPEGQTELPPESSFLHESDMDLMGGVDFRKGCYVGQELVIRTQHTGVVRKRILPCILYDDPHSPPQGLIYDEEASKRLLAEAGLVHQNPSAHALVPPGADVKSAEESGRKARSKGKWLGGVGSLGLALCRLEEMTGIGPAGKKIESWDGGGKWRLEWPNQSEESKRLRIKAFVPQWWAERKQKISKMGTAEV